MTADHTRDNTRMRLSSQNRPRMAVNVEPLVRFELTTASVTIEGSWADFPVPCGFARVLGVVENPETRPKFHLDHTQDNTRPLNAGCTRASTPLEER